MEGILGRSSPAAKTEGSGRNSAGGEARADGGGFGSPSDGGAQEVERSREQAGYARLDLAKHLVLLVHPGINGGGKNLKGARRRSATVAGGLIRRRRRAGEAWNVVRAGLEPSPL
jgi:hypothetical protein